MKGIQINIKDFNVSDEFEMVKIVTNLLVITKKLSFSNTELFALTFFIVKGYNKVTKEELVSNKLLKTHNAVANLVSKFRKYGIIVKSIKGEELHSDFNFFQENLDVIKFDIIVKK